MITKRQEYAKIEILVDGQIQLRLDTVIEEDGIEISRTYHRSVLAPGDDISKVTDARIAVITPILWTQAVIDSYKQKQAINPLPIIAVTP